MRSAKDRARPAAPSSAAAIALRLIAAAVILSVSVRAADACATPQTAIGLARIVEVDANAGPLFGHASRLPRQPDFLAPGEVVLTFDDGPAPALTRPILDTLERHCTRATFFAVGKMAIAHPDTAREVVARGHTLASHTWSHPLSLRRLTPAAAHEEIERGIAAVAKAAGRPIAPFFRFPGLSDNTELMGYLATRGIAAFTADVITDDSFAGSAEELVRNTMSRLQARGNGILLFHDIKPVTARALPEILARLKAGGFRVVHLRPITTIAGLPGLDADMEQRLEAARRPGQPPPSIVAQHPGANDGGVPVTRIAATAPRGAGGSGEGWSTTVTPARP